MDLQSAVRNREEISHILINLIKRFTKIELAYSASLTPIEDQIVDGVTNKAPSQNAVYNALLTKASLSDVITMDNALQIQIDTKANIAGQIFTGNISAPNLSGVNTGDETTSSIQTKRPLKTIEGQSLEGIGDIDLNKTDVGLSNVDNTSDLNKPISTATQTALNLKEDKSNKGIANGYASLDSGGKVPVGQLPSSIMKYKGIYNAATNTPSLVNGVGDIGDIYRVSVAGAGVNGLNFIVGDYVIYNGTTWEKSHSGADNVVSVFGRAGAVVAQNGDYNTDLITNGSLVSGVTTTDALNNLNTNKQDKTTSLKSYSSNKKVVNNTKKAIFSFIWDDLQDSDLLVYNIFQEFGYVPNYAPTTNIFNSSVAPLYVDLYQKGCSILAHSVTHPYMSDTTLTNAQVNAQMVDSKKTIESYGIRVSGWVTPSSVLNPIYYPQIDKNFGYGFTNFSGNFNETVNPLRLSRIGLEDAMAGHNLANVIAIIDDAIASNKMITFYGHHLPSTYLNPDTTPYLTETDLRDILTYLKTKTDENLCQVLSTDEAVKVYYDYNPVNGAGVTNRLAKWISPSILRESIISDDGGAATVNGFFRTFGTINSTYSPAIATASNGNMVSINNLFNADGISSLLNFNTNKTNGVNATTYLGAISTAVNYQSIFVFGRKIDATNWSESFRVGYGGNFMINTSADDLTNKLQVNGGTVISDAPSGLTLRLNRGTGGVIFGNVLNADDLILYNKAGSIMYQRWNANGSVVIPNLAGTGTQQVVASSTGVLSTSALSILKLAVTTAPASPINGDIWLESNTNTGLKIRIAGVTKTISLI